MSAKASVPENIDLIVVLILTMIALLSNALIVGALQIFQPSRGPTRSTSSTRPQRSAISPARSGPA